MYWLIDTEEEHFCPGYDEDECRYQFVYNETKVQGGNVKLAVRAQKHLECQPIVDLFWIVVVVIVATVLIGLAMLLLWKLLTTIHDRREFTRFEKEKLLARWDQVRI